MSHTWTPAELDSLDLSVDPRDLCHKNPRAEYYRVLNDRNAEAFREAATASLQAAGRRLPYAEVERVFDHVLATFTGGIEPARFHAITTELVARFSA